MWGWKLIHDPSEACPAISSPTARDWWAGSRPEGLLRYGPKETASIEWILDQAGETESSLMDKRARGTCQQDAAHTTCCASPAKTISVSSWPVLSAWSSPFDSHMPQTLVVAASRPITARVASKRRRLTVSVRGFNHMNQRIDDMKQDSGRYMKFVSGLVSLRIAR